MSRALLASYGLGSARLASRFAMMMALLALTACSLSNDPLPLPLPPQDGGALDGSPLDGGDAGDGGNVDGGPICRAREICFNAPALPSVEDGLDDDCDGATGCDDLDCANEARCCGGSDVPLFRETWGSVATISANWTFAAPDTAATFAPSGMALMRFGSDDRLHSLMPNSEPMRCVPLALGARIELLVTPTLCTGCADEAAVVLTGADAPARGAALAADLRVAIRGDGSIDVRSGSTPLLTGASPMLAAGRVEIEISPSARDGVAVLSARVSTGPDASETVIVADAPFIAQNLLRACSGGPGLAVAIEGRGSMVSVGALTVTPLACPNPREFRVGGTIITDATVMASGGWHGGGISAPALLSEQPILGGPSTKLHHLFFDASNVERDLEGTAPIDFAVGAAYLGSFAGTWLPVTGADGASGTAYVGVTPPSCTTPPCAARRSVREPSASATYSGAKISGLSYLLAFAREVAPTEPDVFALEYIVAPLSTIETPPAPPSDDSRVLVRPSSTCDSVRDPALAQADEAPEDGQWLFYTCESATRPPSIRAVALEIAAGQLGPVDGTDVEVLSAGIGAYAARGVRAPAPLVRVRVLEGSPTLAVRLWFIAIGSDGRRSLAMAEGQVQLEPGAAVAEAPTPRLSPYPANPLLYGDSSALPPCGGVCDVRDVGIGRLPNDTALTLLVARRVDMTAGGTVWELVPLAQSLEARWWGTP